MSNRLAAFARTPRGAASTTPKEGLVRIDKKFLDSLTSARLAPEVSTVLTRTASEIRITVNANGKGEYKLITRQGSVIADEADVQKIQNLGSFINEERKAVLKSSVGMKTKKLLAAMVQKEAGIVQAGRTLEFSKGFVDVFRTAHSSLTTLDENVSLIGSEVEPNIANELIRQHLHDQVVRIRKATVKFLAHRGTLADGDVPRKLNEFLHDEGALSWVFTRLTAQKLQMNVKGFELRHVYFPKDITKGLAISFAEYRNEDIRENQGGVLKGLAPFQGLFDDNCVRQFCNVPEAWDLDQFGPDADARNLANVPILVPAFDEAVDVADMLGAIGKQADKGMPFLAGNGFTPQDMLKFLGTVPKRVRSAIFPNALRRPGVFGVLFPGFAYDVTDMVNRGIYAQLANWAKTDNYAHCQFLTEYNIDRLILATTEVLAVPLAGPIPGLLGEVFTDPAQTLSNGEKSDPATDSWAGIVLEAMTLSDDAVNKLLTGRLEVSLDSKQKTAKNDGLRLARTKMSQDGENLCRQLRRRGFNELSERVAEWLRTFLTTTMQEAVAYSIAAKLEAYLASPVEYGGHDLKDLFEPMGGEWADENDPDEDGANIPNPDDN